ncbi:DNA-binding transcriptional LysR family regulator [Paraburkholderia youngii]|uniref:LysR substrate-binding domain-containing protein n=1 Tax=Paraburkholderia youngii TaxID=2782701 RepID=UPI003D1B33D6
MVSAPLNGSFANRRRRHTPQFLQFGSGIWRTAKLRLKWPEDLQSATLLHNTLHPHWRAWLTRFSNLADEQIEAIVGIEFDQSLMAIDAAVRAQGVVLTSAILVEGELAAGSLVEPFGKALPLCEGYYLVHPDADELQPGVKALKAWMAERMAVKSSV